MHWTNKNLLLFKVFNTVAGIITALFVFGMVQSRPTYFVVANTIMKCFLAGWLIYRFRESNTEKLSHFDRHACFVAGMYILLATFADSFQYIKLFLKNKILAPFNYGLHTIP